MNWGAVTMGIGIGLLLSLPTVLWYARAEKRRKREWWDCEMRRKRSHLADATEATALALMAWERHLDRCVRCASRLDGGLGCSAGQALLRAYGEACHNEIHAELVVSRRPLTDCGECSDRILS